MPIQLEGSEFDTAVGRWRIENISEGTQRFGSDCVDYHLRCKWVDQSRTDNKSTPERRLILTGYRSQEGSADYEKRLKEAIFTWLDGVDESSATFDYESRYLRFNPPS